MVRRYFYSDPDEWEEAKNKAGEVPLSVILRRLIRMWLRGEITLELVRGESDE